MHAYVTQLGTQIAQTRCVDLTCEMGEHDSHFIQNIAQSHEHECSMQITLHLVTTSYITAHKRTVCEYIHQATGP